MRSSRSSLLPKLALAILAPVLFLFALETALTLAGIEPEPYRRDPFVGLSRRLPLFVPAETVGDDERLVTAPNKRDLFNVQTFTASKPPGAYRIFCLGGSTTYGRPFDDRASFVGWLRELLPAADPERTWEVVNAGGISYASYRVAFLMEELARHEPDLFIIYTGHNEFLEERTYGPLRDVPGLVTAASRLLMRTRIGTAGRSLLQGGGSARAATADERFLLPQRVETVLDHSAGPERYERDAALAEKITRHYRLSLHRMVEIARAAGADVLFVRPAANLAACSPFKSQHTDGLSAAQEASSVELVATARERLARGESEEALEALDEALAIDPRYAEIQYRRGQALYRLGDFERAKTAFEKARDEDVCPLRATSSILAAFDEVTTRTGVPVLDFQRLLEESVRNEYGHAITGAESFVDHVHPTPDGNRLLAVALIEALARRGTLTPETGWGPARVAEVARRVEASIDPAYRARALANLAWTLDWAGKDEDSRRIALDALEYGVEDPMVLLIVARHHAFDGDMADAIALAQRAIRADPTSSLAYYQMGLFLIRTRQLDAAAAHLLTATVLAPEDDKAHRQLGLVLAARGHLAAGLSSLLAAQRLNPGSPGIDRKILEVRRLLGSPASAEDRFSVTIDRFSSGFPRVVALERVPADGARRPHGVVAEWRPDGGLHRVVPYVDGRQMGAAVTWPPEGRAGISPPEE